MKRIILSIIGFFILNMANACPVCEKQQPKITRGLTHGVGPQSNWDWVIIGIMTLITLVSLFYSLKFLLKPGEKNHNHIKQLILNN